ncbi:uncharacterized protein LOC128746016 [Sabethes cyaneus]|uniref:uncharacterized protein LOC128746016 n=1 Tax=Sabethes cyaneus TaxID=53552 RepID=UPI00237D9CA8|nr:uncharacterized protein LOC128746016 [Sabethes cyaneus]
MSKKSTRSGNAFDVPAPGMVEEIGDNPVTGAVTSTVGGTPSVVVVSPPNSVKQVNADVANSNKNPLQTKTTTKGTVNYGKNAAGTAIEVRRNPVRDVRRNRDCQCQLCEERDNEEMVQCDGCDRWYHFVCVHVSEDIANVSWVCPNCKEASVPPTDTINASNEQQRPNPPPKKTLSVHSKSKASSRNSEAKRIKALELKKLEEELELEKRFLQKKYQLLKAHGSETSTEAGDVEDNVSKVEQWLTDTERHGEDSGLVEDETNGQIPNATGKPEEHHASDVIHQQQNPSILRNNQLANHQRSGLFSQPVLRAGQPNVQPFNQGSQYNRTLHGSHSLSVAQTRSTEAGPQIQQTEIQQSESYTPRANDVATVRPAMIPNGCNQQCYQNVRETRSGARVSHAPAINTASSNSHARTSFVPSMNLGTLEEGNHFIPGQRSTPLRSGRPESDLQTTTHQETVCILNRSQIAARQAVSKDLPEFNGTLEEWPLFYSMFNSSTQMCGFTDEENMLRLRKCLKGKALEAVRCELLHPSNVVDVLCTLKMLYGRPEAIVQSIVKKIRSMAPPNMEKLETVVSFALAVKNMVATIKACGIDDFIYNSSLRCELVERLPSSLRLDWARYTRNATNQNLATFSSWLYTVAEDASAVVGDIGRDQRTRSFKKDGFLNFHSESTSKTSKPIEAPGKHGPSLSKHSVKEQCIVCKGDCPMVAKCSTFAGLSYDSKWATVKECKLCRKCLRKHNGSCKRQKKCGTDECTFLHHPLLHNPEKNQNPRSSTSYPSTTTPSQMSASDPSCNVHQGQSAVLFRIVPVILYGPKNTVHTYAFIDDGSELTLMDQDLANELGVEGPRKSLCLKWTGGTRKVEDGSQQVNLQISGTQGSKKYELRGVYTMSYLQIRPQTLVLSEMQKKYPHLAGIPLEAYQDISPRILIGLDNAKLGYVIKSREGKQNEPIAVKTRLGWMVYGNCAGKKEAAGYLNHHSVQTCEYNHEHDESLHKAMKSYFALDSLGIVKPSQLLLSQEEQRAQTLLKSLTVLRENRYMCGLLWKYENVRLPDSKTMALRRWKCLQNRMNKDPGLAEALKAKMQEHISKGYVRKLSSEELREPHSKVWYLPIFAVVNPNKPAKIRLVWDAAATAHNISLNSVLLKGPDQLASLLSVLIGFREYKVAVCGDIREMFHQILMLPEDQHCQRFFWQEGSEAEPGVYVVQVMTFGASCSPSIAQHVKNTNAKRFERDYPVAVDAITKRHYVDDMLISTETEEEALKLAEDVKKIHAKGGFEIKNWISNSKKVQTTLNGEAAEAKNLDIGEEAKTEKVLGMWWSTVTDCYTYKMSSRYDEALLSGTRRPTKREVLRVLMMVYDPLGFISHLLMFLKVLLQEIWRTSTGWDDPIQNAQFEKWSTWLAVFPQITSVEVPRCYRLLTSVQAEVEMHTFVDASENGFAAVVYLRFQEGCVIECALAGAKTRVAPLKFLSIPRSELQAALLGVRLSDTILKSLTIKVSRRVFWTDSKDVLCWIKSDHRRYSQFVAFRVSEILETTEISEWRWVPTKQNAADDGTKWARNPDLSADSRWFRGPKFLRQEKQQWPVTPNFGKTTDEELRPHLLFHASVTKSVIDPQAFSKWISLLRRTAYIFRYVDNLKRSNRKEHRVCGPLKQQELSKAENYLFRLAQSEGYPDEVASLVAGYGVKSPKGKSIRNNPLFRSAFLDENGIVRIRGRTKACVFADRDATEPIILPRHHQVKRLIITDAHDRFQHQNHNTIMNELLQRYRIPRLKATYHTLRKSCQHCKNYAAKPQPPAMGDLPQARLAAFSRPFTYMGVDYFGPILVSVGRHSEKRWGVLATCLTTRAIYLQIAHTLSTNSCIMAIRNVMVRRGVPAVIYSDNGTNFQGTSKELKAAIGLLDQDKLAREFTTTRTQWTFIPPASPHMGGAWERLIRSVKQNLAKLQSCRLPTDEVLLNAMAEIENIVNSRPLTEIPVDGDESPVLTPNDFLLGSANGLRSWVPFDDSPLTQKNCWIQSQIMADQFWKRWVRDYMPTITRRTKWFTPAKPIAVGDIVVIVDPKFHRNHWPKGRVIDTHQAPDGQVRWATVQSTSGGIYERPAVSLAVLDIGVGTNTLSEDSRIPEGTVSCALSK